ncbi:MAG: hypothetical protein A4E28_01742 [Methanocella sp. PtaU1.Bin125]|nr:MAG: hypothetical protein A4E28_01742 [Methanocella sp. PtaU1.Bin125]
MEKPKNGWLNSTVRGTSLTSILSDFSRETVTVLLPSFLAKLTREGGRPAGRDQRSACHLRPDRRGP